jgi:proline racemase
MAEANMCTIRVVRPSQFADMIRSYQILLNGKDAGTISRNGVLEIAVPAGPITIEATIDWGRSRPLAINTVPGQLIEIEVSNHWGALLALWAITFGKNSYLLLTPRPTGAGEKDFSAA